MTREYIQKLHETAGLEFREYRAGTTPEGVFQGPTYRDAAIGEFIKVLRMAADGNADGVDGDEDIIVLKFLLNEVIDRIPNIADTLAKSFASQQPPPAGQHPPFPR